MAFRKDEKRKLNGAARRMGWNSQFASRHPIRNETLKVALMVALHCCYTAHVKQQRPSDSPSVARNMAIEFRLGISQLGAFSRGNGVLGRMRSNRPTKCQPTGERGGGGGGGGGFTFRNISRSALLTGIGERKEVGLIFSSQIFSPAPFSM